MLTRRQRTIAITRPLMLSTAIGLEALEPSLIHAAMVAIAGFLAVLAAVELRLAIRDVVAKARGAP